MIKISEEIKQKVRNQIESAASILGIKDIDYLFNKIRKVGKGDKNGILKNYEEFLNTPEEDRIGNLFKIFRRGACNESV
ncbi:MAG: hypothetical protein ACO2OY_01665, partial [Thermodesulfobacteriaceae bacterium]